VSLAQLHFGGVVSTTVKIELQANDFEEVSPPRSVLESNVIPILAPFVLNTADNATGSGETCVLVIMETEDLLYK
jgi:hypothetical protein